MKNDKTAIVTGGSRGIGKAIAKIFAQNGFNVAIIYASNKNEATKTVHEITDSGGMAIAYASDIADETQMAALFEKIVSDLGAIDVVVNSAGLMHLSLVADIDWNLFDAMIRTNLRGAFVVSQLAAKYVREGGSILNFSSSVTKLAPPTYGAYAATKGGVEVLALIFAKELSGRNITVNTIAPGPTATDLFFNGKDDETIERTIQMNPMKRLGEPEDIANLVLDIVTSSRWVNGQTIYVNGGVI
jgi:3-oxoacyl-[acyl-carrier protein] reductase